MISAQDNKVEEQRKVWGAGKGGWTQERKPRFPFGPWLNLVNYETSNELMYYLHMLPVRYYHEVILPLTDEVALLVDWFLLPRKMLFIFMVVWYQYFWSNSLNDATIGQKKILLAYSLLQTLAGFFREHALKISSLLLFFVACWRPRPTGSWLPESCQW